MVGVDILAGTTIRLAGQGNPAPRGGQPGDLLVEVFEKPNARFRRRVEAAREVGGRELLRLPFQWPPKAPATAKVAGEHELGAVTLHLKP